MATKQEFLELIGKALVDDAFRAKLFADPVAAAREAGVELTPEQQNQLSSSDLKALVEDIDTRLSKFIPYI